MNKKSFSKFVVGFLFFYMQASLHKVSAQTVQDHIYLQNKINKFSESLSYDEISSLFADNPLYNVDCIEDKSASKTNTKSATLAFSEYISQNYFNSYLQFLYTPLDYGFNLESKKINKETKDSSDTFSFTTETMCASEILEHQDKTKNCGSFMFSDDKEILIDSKEDSFFPEATKSESWKVYFIDKNLLIANVAISFSANKKSWIGQKKGVESFSQNFICALTLDQQI